MEIIQIDSQNQSERQKYVPDIICCHQPSGEMSSCINWFKNYQSRVSSHFGVAKDGNVYQFVPIKKLAWANCSDRYNEDKHNYNM